MDKTNLVIDLWVGLNGGYITTDEYKEMIELHNFDAIEFNQSNESLIARHNTKLSSEFVSAWTQEDCNEFIEVGCSLQQDMEWANESENIEF